ncbi:MAG: glycosyltransferase [Dongiaceae bacterium]
MRVLMMLSGLGMGGAERNVVSLLPRLASAGAEVALATLGSRRDGRLAAELAASAIERIDLDAPRLLHWPAHRRLVALLGERRFDLVHAQDQYAILTGAAACWRTGDRFVLTRHVLEEPQDSWRRRVRARLVLAAARGSTRVVAVSEAVRDRFRRQARLAADRIEVIHNGIEVERFAGGAREATRARLGWGPRDRVALLVAVLRPGKGHALLLDAAPALAGAVPGLRLAFAGGGPLAAELRQRAGAAAVPVELLGERADIPDLMAAADAVVLPSSSEGLPTVLIEAGAAGRPVVATRTGGAPEIVLDGRTGFLVPVGDAGAFVERLAAVLAQPGLAAGLGAAARAHVAAAYSIEAQARRTLALSEAVLARR